MQWIHRSLQMKSCESLIMYHNIAQVKMNLVWRAMSKVGRNRGHNRDLKPVSWVLHKSALHSVNSN